ncbi:unnamed protein product [Clonostachys rosea f. rosea IK726]|uniref:Uncharacterized protein n=1 Tax=Clonostachys rosea f. rosea IK726 TaxID=1349383 RepID=A0ACA9U9K7_BIOOC|nr:unnamed protein product [Clonostachys rosea f. rosea IK726]
MASLIKVLFVVGKNESLRGKLLHFWDELTSTVGWRLTGYGSWAVEEGSVPLPGLLVVTARESCLQCFPDSAEAILLAHDFVRVKTITGHQSINARALNYPSMFKVILGGQSTNQTVLRVKWQGFWYKFTETNLAVDQVHPVLLPEQHGAGHDGRVGGVERSIHDAQEILQAHGFRAKLPETGMIPEFQSPADIPDVKLNDFLTHPRSRLVKVFFVDSTGPGVPLPRPRLRKFMDDLVSSEAGIRAGYNWNFSRDNEILFSAGSA